VTTTNTYRKRGRPPAFDRNKAIDIALELFWQKGYDGVGVAELGNAIGINPPSLYKAFGSKHGLFEEAVQLYITEKKGGFLPSALADAKSLKEAIGNLLIQAAKSYTSRNKPLGCLILSGTCNSADSEALVITDTHRRATKKYLSNIFLNLGAKDVDGLAEYVLIAMTGLSFAARQGVKRKALIKTAVFFATIEIISQSS
jgi:TetR/AcrR family transcriptional regulator, repressor for divergent bdcA